MALTVATPAAARAVELRVSDLAGSNERREDRLRIDVPPLQLDDAALLDDAGSGAGQGRVDPVVALILGIFPGFGLGHYVAGSPQWTRWLFIDAVMLAGVIVLSAADVGVLVALGWVAILVVHVIEGLDAHAKAGGRRLAAAPRDAAKLAHEEAPVREPPVRAREFVLARF